MQTKKLSFEMLENELNLNEMSSIMAGSGGDYNQYWYLMLTQGGDAASQYLFMNGGTLSQSSLSDSVNFWNNVTSGSGGYASPGSGMYISPGSGVNYMVDPITYPQGPSSSVKIDLQNRTGTISYNGYSVNLQMNGSGQISGFGVIVPIQ